VWWGQLVPRVLCNVVHIKLSLAQDEDRMAANDLKKRHRLALRCMRLVSLSFSLGELVFVVNWSNVIKRLC
jgi:hypothetical protein